VSSGLAVAIHIVYAANKAAFTGACDQHTVCGICHIADYWHLSCRSWDMPAVPLVLHATLLHLPVCVCCMADLLVQPTQALVPPGPAAADDKAVEAGVCPQGLQ
jgi:hypothetical protein